MSRCPSLVESKAIRAPSRDQRGEPTEGPPKKVSCTGFKPSLSQIQTSSLPERLEPNAILWPFGENWPLDSTRVEEINLVGGARKPFELGPPIRQMFASSSRCEKTRRLPSRERDG